MEQKVSDALRALERKSEATTLANAIQDLAVAVQERSANGDICLKLLLNHEPPTEKLLMQAMDKYQSNLELQQAACLAISEFVSLSGEFRDRIQQVEIYRSVLHCVSQFQSDATLQAVGCQAMACLAMGEYNRSMMVKGDAGALAFLALNIHRDDVTVQENACKAISYLIRDNEGYQLKIIQNTKYISWLLETLSIHKQDEDVFEQTFWALRALCSTDEAQKILLEFNWEPPVYELAVKALKDFSQEEGVQSAACGILEALCAHAKQPILHKLVDDLNAFEVVTDSMGLFADSPQIQWFGCSLVAYLAKPAVDLGMTELDDYILELIYEAMKRHCEVEEGSVTAGSTRAAANSSRVQEAACRALSQLLHLRLHLREQIGEDLKSDVKLAAVSGFDVVKHTADEPSCPIAENESNFQWPLHQSVMYVLMCYMTDPYLFRSGCDALYNMVVDCSRLQNLLMHSGAQQTCLIGMEHHLHNLVVQECGCRALRALSSGSDECKLTLKRCGGFDAMVRILSWLKQGNNSGIGDTLIEEAIGVIACLGNIDLSAINGKVYSLILDAMSQFQENQHLQEVSLEAIGTCFTHKDSEGGTGSMVPGFNMDDTCRNTIKAMEKHVQNEGIQQMGCFVLRHILKPEFLERDSVCNQYASVISKALGKHRGNNVLAEASLTVLELARTTENIAQTLVKHHVHIHLFSILEQGAEDLFTTVSECIYVLGVTRKLNNEMLLSAVEKGHHKAISALLEIGADPTCHCPGPSAGGSHSAFCLACSKGDFKAVSIMIKKGISDVQPGLNIAKERNHHWVVGLLLYHAFLKLGGVFWGNLGLGTLNPIWLYKSLDVQTEDFPHTPDDLDYGTVQNEFHRQSASKKSENKEQTEDLKCLFSPSPSTDFGSNQVADRSQSVGSANTAKSSTAKSSSVGLTSDSFDQVGGVSPINAGHYLDSRGSPEELDNIDSHKSGRKSSTVSQGKDKKISDISIDSYNSDILESGPRRSASVGSTSSCTSVLSDGVRRISEPSRHPPCWKTSFTVCHHRANLQDVESLDEAVTLLWEVAHKMKHQEQSRPSPVTTGQESEDLHRNCHEGRRSKTSKTGVISRRTSRCDLVGVPLEPINMDVGVVKRPELTKERRRSLQGTMSGADLPLTTPDALSRKVWSSTLEEDSEVRSFSPRIFRRVIRGENITDDDAIEDEVFSDPSQPSHQSELSAIGLKRVVASSHTSESGRMTSPDSEYDTDSRGSSTPTPITTPKRNLSFSFEKPGKSKGKVSLIDISANGIECLSSLAEADRRLLEKLKYVTHLDLSQNKFSEIPVSLREWLEGLTNLNLQYNNFTRLPGQLLVFPRLQVLEASHNKIETIEARPDVIVSANSSPLKTLVLSHNQIKKFPSWLCKVAGNLVDLNLSNNSIKRLPEGPLELYCLESLSLAYNEISEIPEQMLKKCPNLEKVDLSKNNLECLPSGVAASLGKLSNLTLPHNYIGRGDFPQFVLELPNLHNLDMSDNELTTLPPPAEWKTKSLLVLLLGDNFISQIDLGHEDDIQWSYLKRMSLRNNHLSELPQSIGYLTSLGSLDVSHTGITKLPLQIGKLTQLWDLPLDGLAISNVPFDVSIGRTTDLVKWLRQSLDNSEQYFHVRMITMGGRGQGKTTVLSKVTGQNLDRKHQFCGGIAISTWKFQNRSRGRQTPLPEYEVSCWEFVGHRKYALAHQCFLTSRVIYMVVYKLTGQFSEVNQVKAILLNVEAHSCHSAVLVIGTHLDKVDRQYADDVHSHLADLIGKPGFPRHAMILEVDTTDSSDVAGLQDHVKATIVGAKDDSNQPLLGQLIPRNYMDLKALIKKESERIRKSCASAAFPIIMRQAFDALLKKAKIEVEQRVQAAQFLQENGVLVHFEDPFRRLNELYILDPGWLCDMVARVRKLKKQHYPTQGVVHHQAVYDLFPEKTCPSENFPQLLRILDRFHILLPFDDDHFLVPSFLRTTKPSIDLPLRAVVHRKYCMPYIPSAFWSHLIARMILFAEDIIQVVMSGAEGHPLANMQYWNKGIAALWNEVAYLVVEEQDENVVNICVPTTSYGSGLLVSVVNHIDSLIEEWYPGLAGVDIHGDPLVRKLAPCGHCKEPEIHDFDILELISISTQENSVECPVHKGSVSLLELAPDVVLGDIEESTVIERFDYDDSPKYQLGDGAFGCVYKATYKNKPVAVKVFKMPGDTAGSENPHQQLRLEVNVLRLQHPSIVKLEAVSLRPRHLLVLELAPHGTLRSHMKKSRQSSRQLQHRIASQVAEGIAFLHQKRIMYRDLKSDNVLLFSINPNASVMNAKLTDFGIACFATPSGVFDPKGTPGHRAPEVIRHQPYGLSVDIYSLGLFYFELATNGHKLFSDIASQPNAIDGLIDQKSDSIPGSSATDITRFGSAAWPDMQDLIDCCLQPSAEKRPKAEQVVARLNKTEFLCLKRVVQVATGMNVEAIAVRKTKHSREDREKLEVWMGSGEGRSGHVCKVNLSDGCSQAAGFVVHDKSRVLAMLAIGESLILAGTASGRLWIYDVNTDVPNNGHEVRLPDAVLCLMHFKDLSRSQVAGGVDYVLAGLADGQIAKFDTNSLYCKTDIPDFHIRLGYHPICSMFSAKKRFWFSHGTEIVVYKHTNLKKEEMRWTANSNDSTGFLKNISHVVVSSKHVWTTTKHSPILRQWDAETPKIRGEINCSDSLRPQDKALSSGVKSVDQFRVTSVLLMPPNEALWVGLGSGHIIIFCPVKLTVLLVLHRSTYPVRIMAVAKLEDEGKPMQLVLTGCHGFRTQEQNDANIDLPHEEQMSGCLLVWERDLHRQEQTLENYRKKRKAFLQL